MIRAPIFVRLAIVGIAGGFIMLVVSPGRMAWHGVGLLLLGSLSLILAYTGIGRRQPGTPRSPTTPVFSLDDPEVAHLPPTSTSGITQRFKLAREKERGKHDAI